MSNPTTKQVQSRIGLFGMFSEAFNAIGQLFQATGRGANSINALARTGESMATNNLLESEGFTEDMDDVQVIEQMRKNQRRKIIANTLMNDADDGTVTVFDWSNVDLTKPAKEAE